MAIHIVHSEVLAGSKYNLRKVVFQHTNKTGALVTQTRFVFDRGNGAAILLYNREAGTVILTRQFRLPAYLNGDPTGMSIEVCAGELDNDAPEDAIRREAEEEVGYRVGAVTKVFESYMSPGAATEIVHFFIGEYSADMRVGEGGGLVEEQEEIEVLEVPLDAAIRMVREGVIRDAKTIMLLLWVKGEIFSYI